MPLKSIYQIAYVIALAKVNIHVKKKKKKKKKIALEFPYGPDSLIHILWKSSIDLNGLDILASLETFLIIANEVCFLAIIT